MTLTAAKPAKSRTKSSRAQLSNAEYHLSATDIGRLINAATSVRDAMLLRLLAETGIRRGEVVKLQTSDVDQAQRLLTIRYGKNAKLRVIPISVSLVQSLHNSSAPSESSYLFLSGRGNPLSIRQLNRLIAAAGVRAGVRSSNPRRSTVTPHLLRHSFARLWKQSGGSIESLSKILGHASVKTTWDLYGTEGLEDIQRNYDATLPRLFPEQYREDTAAQESKSAQDS